MWFSGADLAVISAEIKLVKTLEQMRLPADGGKRSSRKRMARKETGKRGGRLRGLQFSSVAQSGPTVRPHGLQHARPPCPSPAPGVYSNSCPLSR